MINLIKLSSAAFALAAAAVFCAPAYPAVQLPAAPAKSVQQRKPVQLQTPVKMRNETKWLVYCMERGHYLKMPITELDVREFIREYMQNVDFFKLFFTAGDVQHFQDFFSPSIDVMLHQGTLLPAFSIYDKFLDRADARLEWIREIMKKPFDFSEKATFRPDRSKEEWPEDWEAANRLWENRLKYDIVNEILSYSAKKRDAEKSAEKREGAKPAEKPAGEKGAEAAGGDSAAAETEAEKVAEVVEEEEEAPKTFEEKLAKAEKEVLRRYERLIENYRKADAMEIQEIYLNTLSRLYDPHSSFLSEYYLEEFDISVRNALVGIGALLQDKDGYCTISELMPGGPAEECKQISPGDKILGVGQETGEIVDVIGMKLRNTVRMIRGKSGTKVRLLIEPASNPSARKTITLVRREIKLTTKLAKAEVYTVPVGDKTLPVGVIDLPAFYGEGGFNGESKGFSTTKDVEELLLKLKKFGVKGVILDLRRNGGGFLTEAVDLAGLFIKRGPVVQVRNAAGRTERLWDEDPKLVWDGPLIIMVSRLSASATEIVAGAPKPQARDCRRRQEHPRQGDGSGSAQSRQFRPRTEERGKGHRPKVVRAQRGFHTGQGGSFRHSFALSLRLHGNRRAVQRLRHEVGFHRARQNRRGLGVRRSREPGGGAHQKAHRTVGGAPEKAGRIRLLELADRPRQDALEDEGLEREPRRARKEARRRRGVCRRFGK